MLERNVAFSQQIRNCLGWDRCSHLYFERCSTQSTQDFLKAQL